MSTTRRLPFLEAQSETSSSKSLGKLHRLLFGRCLMMPILTPRSMSSISASHSYLVRAPHSTSPSTPTRRISPPSRWKDFLETIAVTLSWYIPPVTDCISGMYHDSSRTSMKSGSFTNLLDTMVRTQSSRHLAPRAGPGLHGDGSGVGGQVQPP